MAELNQEMMPLGQSIYSQKHFRMKYILESETGKITRVKESIPQQSLKISTQQLGARTYKRLLILCQPFLSIYACNKVSNQEAIGIVRPFCRTNKPDLTSE